MSDTDDLQLRIQTADGPVLAIIPRAALTRLSGRTHLTAEETLVAHRIELEDIVRDKLGLSYREIVRLDERDF